MEHKDNRVYLTGVAYLVAGSSLVFLDEYFGGTFMVLAGIYFMRKDK